MQLQHFLKTWRGGAKVVSNLIMTEVLRELSERNRTIDAFSIEPRRLAGLAAMFAADSISSKNVKDIFSAMLESDASPEEISREKGFVQVSDTSFIEDVVASIIEENAEAVARYREGKESLLGFFVGQTMKRTAGKANPKMVNEILRRRLAGEEAE